ncbi:MAG: hypothetical protein ACE5R6_18115 [Candidatus Heimdallarchaeota archaeon]
MALKNLQRSALIFWLLASVLSGAFIGSGVQISGEQEAGPPTVQPGIPVELPDGAPATVIPGKAVQIVTPSGVQIDLTVGETVEITVSFTRDPPAQLPEQAHATLPEGVASLDLYLTIELNDTDASVDAELAVPYTDEEVAAANLREDSLVLHYWDPEAGDTGMWMPIANPGIDTAKNYVTGRTPHFSTWTILGEQQPPRGPPETVQPGIPFDLEDGVPAAIKPGEMVTVNTPGNAVINVTVGKAVEINVTFTRDPPAQLPEQAHATLPEGVASLDLYLTIELNDTDASVDAELAVPYTDEEVAAANLREDSLVLHYWDPEAGDTGMWMPIANPGIDTAKNYVTGRTPHFSTWTILGETTEPEPTTTTEEPAVPEMRALGILPALLGLTIGGSLLVVIRKRRRR